MSYVIFNNIVDMSIAATPSSGYTVAYDLDGIIKQKDVYGVVTPIAGTFFGNTPSLSEVLQVGNTTGTTSLIVASGTSIISDYGTSQIEFRTFTHSHILLTSDNGTGQQSIIDFNSEKIILNSSGSGREIKLGVAYNYNSGDYEDIAIKENVYLTRSVDDRDKSAVFIGTRNSTIADGLSNSVVIGGRNINATKTDTVYLGNSVNINNAYTLPGSDGSLNQVLRTDGAGQVSWSNESLSPNLATVLSVGATSGLNDIIMDVSQVIKSATGTGRLNLLDTFTNSVSLSGGIQESIIISDYNFEIYVTSSVSTQSSISIGSWNDDFRVSSNATVSNTKNTNKNPVFISTRSSTASAGITNSAIIGGTGILATMSNTVYVSNLQLQGNVLGKYTVQPSTQPDWDSLSIPTKGYVDSLISVGLTGTGTTNYFPRWTSTTSLSSTSSIFEIGSTVSVTTNMSINGVYAGKGPAGISTNTVFGFEAINSSTSSGVNNTAIGSNALRINGPGSDNTSVGLNSLQFNVSGNKNTAVGAFSLRTNSTGNENTAIGYYALFSNTTGDRNLSVGFESYRTNTTGIQGIAIGNYSLYSNTTGNNNIAIGYESLYKNDVGVNNLGIGYQSLYNNLSGSNNISIGLENSKNITSGQNTSLGVRGLFSSTNTQNNTAIGYESLYSNVTGRNNTAIGASAGWNNSIGDNNTFLGFNTGRGLTSGSNNTFVGSNITVASSVTGSIYISDGNGNSRIMADSTGKVGINTLSPNTQLDINGDLAIRHGSVITITGTNNDYTTNNTSFIVFQNISGSDAIITGFSGGYTGKRLLISNIGPDAIILNHQNTNSSLNNRIITGNLGTNFKILDNQSCELIYDSIENRWRICSISSPSLLSFTNGIYEINTNTYGFGGTISQNTLIDGNGYTFSIIGSNNISLSASTVNLGQNVTINNSYTLPTNAGTNNYILTTNGSGTTTWNSASSLGLSSKHTDLRNFTASIVETINHNLSTQDVIVQSYDSTGTQIIPGTVQVTGTGSVEVTMSSTLTNIKTIILG